MWWAIGVAVLVVLVVSAIVMAMPKSPNIGDSGKLSRTYSAAEQSKLDTVRIPMNDLEKADGEDGAHCWILVDGVVYDMSVFPAWARGRHHGIKAGSDATDKFVDSSHAVDILQRMPVVGRIESLP